MMSTNQCWRIEKDDVLTTLAALGDNSFDGLFMDSPYGLTFMEKKWTVASLLELPNPLRSYVITR